MELVSHGNGSLTESSCAEEEIPHNTDTSNKNRVRDTLCGLNVKMLLTFYGPGLNVNCLADGGSLQQLFFSR
jgi:hypothetical protein